MHEERTHCALPAYKCRASHTHISFPLIAHLCSLAHMQAHASVQTNTRCTEPSDTELLTVALDWYSPATVTGQTSLSSVYSYIFHYPWPEAFDTVGSRNRVGLAYLLLWHQTWQRVMLQRQQEVESFRGSKQTVWKLCPSQSYLWLFWQLCVYRGEEKKKKLSQNSRRPKPFHLTDYGHAWHPIIWIRSHSHVVVCQRDNIYISLSSQWTVLCALTKA